jgi:hypothetical protein
LIGEQSGYYNTTGSGNTALGENAYAGGNTATGSNNTAIGKDALIQNTTGTENVAVGYVSLDANTTASNNVGVGRHTLGSTTTGGGNTAVGDAAGISNQTGTFNTYVGGDAGSVATGSNNTFVGRYAGGLVTSGANNTILGRYNGNQGGLDLRTSSNNIVLSDGDGNPRVLIDGSGIIRQFGTTNNAGALNLVGEVGVSFRVASFQRTTGGSEVGNIVANASSTSYNTSSDHRLKENVIDLTGATTRLKQLNPVRFNFIADADTTVDGFLAHEVQTVVPEAITGTHNEVDDDGNPVYQGIDQSKLVPLLVATIQELEARIAALEAN